MNTEQTALPNGSPWNSLNLSPGYRSVQIPLLSTSEGFVARSAQHQMPAWASQLITLTHEVDGMPNAVEHVQQTAYPNGTPWNAMNLYQWYRFGSAYGVRADVHSRRLRNQPENSGFRQCDSRAFRIHLDAACKPRFTEGSQVAPCPIHRG